MRQTTERGIRIAVTESHSPGFLHWLYSESESENDALITEEQRSAFANRKQTKPEAEVAAHQAAILRAKEAQAKKEYVSPIYGGPAIKLPPPGVISAGISPGTKPGAPSALGGAPTGAAAAGRASPRPTPAPSPVPRAMPLRVSDEQATAAFNFLQDKRGTPHVKRVWYDAGTDPYNWIGRQLGKKMSMPRSQFDAEIWADYVKANPTKQQ